MIDKGDWYQNIYKQWVHPAHIGRITQVFSGAWVAMSAKSKDLGGFPTFEEARAAIEDRLQSQSE